MNPRFGGRQVFVRLDRDTAINLDRIASISFSWNSEDNISTVLKYLRPTPSAASVMSAK
jgi:hypothetical protein